MKRGIRALWVTGLMVGIILVPALAYGQEIAWIRQFGTASADSAQGIAADEDGRVYVGGYTQGSLDGPLAGPQDAFVRGYDPAANLQWANQFGTAGADRVNALGIDDDGNIFATGGALAFIRRYDRDGNVGMHRNLGATHGDEGLGIAVGGDVVYIVGQTFGNFLGGKQLGLGDAFLTRLNFDGSVVWSRQFGGAFETDQATSVAIGSTGLIYVAGHSGNFAGNRGFVRAYDPAGNVAWKREIGPPGNNAGAFAVAESLGNVYVVGTADVAFDGQFSGGLDAFVQRYDPSGNLVWSRTFGGPTIDQALAVAADAIGNAYVGGHIGERAFVHRVGPDGSLAWETMVDGAGSDHINGIAMRPPGRALFAAGDTDGSLGHHANAGSVDAFALGMVQRTCWDTSSPTAEESTLLSSPIHNVVEPLVGPVGLGPTVHELNCSIIVPGVL